MGNAAKIKKNKSGKDKVSKKVKLRRKRLKLSIPSRLKNVSYKHDPDYVPSTFSLGFVNFIKLVNGDDGEENDTPVIHYKMLDTIAQEKNPEKILNLLFRGAAKTTVFAEYLFLYVAVFRELPNLPNIQLAMYVSDSMDNGVKNLRKNLQYRYDNSEFLQSVIKDAIFTDSRWEFIGLDGKSFVVKGYGALTGIRGVKELGVRPSLCIIDDVLSDSDAKSPTVIKNIEDTIYKAVKYALHPKNSLTIWSGTPFNAFDPIYKAVESGVWQVNLFPVCEKFPVKKKKFRGAWEDRFSYKYVKRAYKDALDLDMVGSFYQELMLEIMGKDERLVPDHDINWYSRRKLLKQLHNYNTYITTDFAVSDKQSADYSVIIVWAYNNKGQWFWIDSVVKKQDMSDNMRDLFSFVREYNPEEVGIEISGQQKGFISWIKDEMIDANTFFNLTKTKNEEGLRPTTNKLVRFNVALPLFSSGKILLPKELKDTEELQEALDELKLISNSGIRSKHDDILDNFSQLPLLNTFKPSQESDDVYTEEIDDGYNSQTSGTSVFKSQVAQMEEDLEDEFAYGSYV